jgi:hypothetical protein
MAVTLNASTSSGLVQTADTSGTIELQSNGTTKLSVLSTGVSGVITQGTAVASTSGTSIDFTGIPSWVKRVTVMFNGVSLNGTSNIQVQIGAGSVTTSGYAGSSAIASTSGIIAGSTFTTGFGVWVASTAANLVYGNMQICLIDSNIWAASGSFGYNAAYLGTSGGSVTLGSTLDRIRITTVNGTDTFDAGTINIQYEG